MTYISLHRGGGSLSDIKRIISQYTDQSNNLISLINDLTLAKQFIVFDLKRPKNDPLSIRVRWDTSLSSISNHPNSISDHHWKSSKFNPYGQKILAEAKKNGALIDLVKNIPSPEVRKKLLVKEVQVKNGITWAKYIY